MRGKTELSGTVDKIELHSDEILSGQIIEQVPGKFIRLLKDDGMVEVISSDKIVTQKKVKLISGEPLGFHAKQKLSRWRGKNISLTGENSSFPEHLHNSQKGRTFAPK